MGAEKNYEEGKKLNILHAFTKSIKNNDHEILTDLLIYKNKHSFK